MFASPAPAALCASSVSSRPAYDSRGARSARSGPSFWACALLIALAVVALAPTFSMADARSDFLVRLLTTSDQFRVRAQAAIALARPNADAAVTDALVRALRDTHPAVRVSAAAALETVGDPRALDPLRAIRRDSDRDVRAAVERSIRTLERAARTTPSTTVTPTTDPNTVVPVTPTAPRYYVSVGEPGAQAAIAAPLLQRAHAYIRQTVSTVGGVEMAPDRETNDQARAVLSRRGLVGYYLENRINSVEMRPDGALRVEVSVTVTSYPGRDIRSMLRGAATIPGADTSDSTRQQAIEGAFRAALRSLPQAFQAGAAAQAARP